MKKKILFLCTGNSCRSQMAEAWCRALQSDFFEAYSAGTEKHGMNPFAVQVMEELGIDMSRHYSKHVSELSETDFDYVVTVCGNAHESCPAFPARSRVVHLPFEDPPKMAQRYERAEEKLACYRRVRDAIKLAIETLRERLETA